MCVGLVSREVLAITCGLMLSRALHSCDMVLAIQRLHMFVADFEALCGWAVAGFFSAVCGCSHGVFSLLQVKWQGVSGQEWRCLGKTEVSCLTSGALSYKVRKYALAWLFVVGFEAGSRAMQLNLEDADGQARHPSLKASDSPTANTRCGAQAWVYTTHAVSLLSFAISSAVLLLVAYVQSHLLLGLDKSLDCCLASDLQHVTSRRGVQRVRRVLGFLSH